MTGLELNENFYFDVVKKLIDEEFPMIGGKYSAGLIGYGSDVLGNDDEFSKDHEWGPRCHIWLTENDYEVYSIQIDEMLKEKLPIEYMGYYTRYIYETSTDEFKSLEVSGACDQWLSNSDLLVWADKFSLLKSIYDKGKCFERNKTGDIIILKARILIN